MAKNQKCGNGGTNMAATVKNIDFLCMAPYLKFVPILWPNIVESFILVLNFARFSVFCAHIAWTSNGESVSVSCVHNVGTAEQASNWTYAEYAWFNKTRYVCITVSGLVRRIVISTSCHWIAEIPMMFINTMHMIFVMHAMINKFICVHLSSDHIILGNMQAGRPGLIMKYIHGLIPLD